MSWIQKILPKTQTSTKGNVPEGIWTKCNGCQAVLYKHDLEKQLEVCPKCDNHMRIGARRRLDAFLDAGDRQELAGDLEPQDVLKFKDSKRYKDRITAAQKSTNEKDALIVMQGKLKGMPIVVASFEFAFMGGSMASVVGARRMHEAAQALLGEQDFSAFRASLCQSKTPFRNVTKVTVTRQGCYVIVDISANAFLHHMVRNIVGSLVEIGSGHQPLDWIATLLAGKDRTLAAATAKPNGLYLVDVDYPAAYGLPRAVLGPLFLPDN